MDDEAGCDSSTIIVDTYDLFDIGLGIDWNKVGVWIFFVAEDVIFHEEIFFLLNVLTLVKHMYLLLIGIFLKFYN